MNIEDVRYYTLTQNTQDGDIYLMFTVLDWSKVFKPSCLTTSLPKALSLFEEFRKDGESTSINCYRLSPEKLEI